MGGFDRGVIVVTATINVSFLVIWMILIVWARVIENKIEAVDQRLNFLEKESKDAYESR